MCLGRTSAILALGANQASEQGAPRDTLEAALTLLEERGLKILARSFWYRSPAWPEGSGPDYVNGAALVSAPLSPKAVLQVLHKVEAVLGRDREGADRWAARPCDLDLIACGSMVSPGAKMWQNIADAPPETPRQTLILPHPQAHRRAFVLAPMRDVAPDWRHPILGKTAATMLAALDQRDQDATQVIA